MTQTHDLGHQLHFKIDHLDPLGQGVSKLNGEKITFIPKTLPGEEGYAITSKENNKIRFAKVECITKESPLRVSPLCSHYATCGGCHYLHMSYKDEISFKISSLKKHFSIYPLQGQYEALLGVVSGKNRHEYKNRLQLHYDLNQKKIGLYEYKSHKITEIKNCLIALPSIQEKVKVLYKDNSWVHLIKKGPKKGHITLIHREQDNSVITQVNSSYSDLESGYEQTNREMNESLQVIIKQSVKEYIQSFCLDLSETALIDLFGGSGNLSSALNKDHDFKETFIFDAMISKQGPQNKIKTKRIPLDLFKKPSLKTLKSYLSDFVNNILILNPPRSGYKFLEDFVSFTSPELIIYVSCHPATLVRDLQTIAELYEVSKIHLVDLFPGTYHFETIAILRRKKGI